MQYTYTRLLVADVPAVTAFYRDILGFTVGYADEEGHYADIQTGDVTIALFRQDLLPEALRAVTAPDPQPRLEQVMLIFAVESVDAAYDELTAKGLAFVTKPTDMPDWGVRVAHFRDPAGTLIEINQPL
jgi:catechol 2,3-dioxygenase-like lactoylglutathione lyase family enzyme